MLPEVAALAVTLIMEIQVERIGEDVGDDDVVGAFGHVVGKVELGFHVVHERVVACGLDGLRVDVRAGDLGRADEFGGNGEDARAAAVVEDTVRRLDVGVKPLQAEVGGGISGTDLAI